MRLTGEVTVPASPDAVFALFDEDAGGAGRVVVPFAHGAREYAGSVRVLAVEPARRRARLQVRGADVAGGGDADAAVDLVAEEAPGGTVLRLCTDLVVRGAVVRFGRDPIEAAWTGFVQGLADGAAERLADRATQRLGDRAATTVSGASPGRAPGSLLRAVARYAVPTAAVAAVLLLARRPAQKI